MYDSAWSEQSVLVVDLQHNGRSHLYGRCLECSTSGTSADTFQLWWTHNTWKLQVHHSWWKQSSCFFCLAGVSLQNTPAAHRLVTSLVYAPLEPQHQLTSHCFSSATPRQGTDSGLFWPRLRNLSPHSTAPPTPLLSGGQFLIGPRVTGFVTTINKQQEVPLISSPRAPLQQRPQHKSHEAGT